MSVFHEVMNVNTSISQDEVANGGETAVIEEEKYFNKSIGK